MQRIYVKKSTDTEHKPFDFHTTTGTYLYLASLVGYTEECGSLSIAVDGGRISDVVLENQMTLVDGVYIVFSWDT